MDGADIGRRLESGTPPLAAARQATAELGSAVVATSLVLVVVLQASQLIPQQA